MIYFQFVLWAQRLEVKNVKMCMECECNVKITVQYALRKKGQRPNGHLPWNTITYHWRQGVIHVVFSEIKQPLLYFQADPENHSFE